MCDLCIAQVHHAKVAVYNLDHTVKICVKKARARCVAAVKLTAKQLGMFEIRQTKIALRKLAEATIGVIKCTLC